MEQQQQSANLVNEDSFKALLVRFGFKNKEENDLLLLLQMFNKILTRPLKQAIAVTLLQNKDGDLSLESAKKRVRVYRWTE
jgi:hypothetical protein